MPSWRSSSRLSRAAGPARRFPTRSPPWPPAPHLDHAVTLLPQGTLGGLCFGRAPEAGTAARQDFTPPSWDRAARYRQPCTSCLKTQGRERERDPSVGSMEGRTQSRREGRPRAAACTTAARLAMVGTRTLPGGPTRPHRLRLQHHLSRASPCRPPSAHCLAPTACRTALPFPAHLASPLPTCTYINGALPPRGHPPLQAPQ